MAMQLEKCRIPGEKWQTGRQQQGQSWHRRLAFRQGALAAWRGVANAANPLQLLKFFDSAEPVSSPVIFATKLTISN